MLYGYDLLQIEEAKKLNKKKIVITVIIIVLIIAIAIGCAILIVNLNNKKDEINQKPKEQIEQIDETERIRIEEENKVKEEKRKEQEKIENIRNSEKFTEEQIQILENIYDDVGEKRVFLTFDDGPNMSVTPFILDLLKKENIKATFFVLGTRAIYNPELIQREYEEGHYVANHGYSHVYREIYQSVDSVFNEYNMTEQVIQDALGNPNYHSKLFRFPGGSVGGYYDDIKSEAVNELRKNGIAALDWNALSRDAEGANTVEELVDNVIMTVGEKNSVVILMHDASDKILTYEALPQIIQYLRENGYAFKNIYDIL